MELLCRFIGFPKIFSVLLVLLMGISLSVSDGGTESKVSYSNGRHLLQAKKSCPVNFEFLNYTIITSRCNGPHYPADICCAAFKELACPYSEYLNDLNTDCASTLFGYINLYGKYPPGLFANECRESRRGLECTASAPTTSENDSSSFQVTCIPFGLLATIAGFLVLLA
ncbi:GPI-anchored protein LLG1-like [Punica granatum]|uniref:GPI-anchored protein LLG1-like n=2 Tax=Punica granatum TaxID=22663 RepID=A0A6P8EKF4_PUNGR|nr:GPI-anchored protein LLG1-like [Punica granatum]XP_031407225.1 GPI-anchored protein LLG1-like [Punica granatum]XP_031407226.1 GPI-anchored protein LLG1-like [Punica granatum]PKI35699.1 hypothetical protein CRG98_043857 [Punica granatum]